MLHDEIRGNINKIAGGLIRKMASRLVRQPALRNQDSNDLQQSLLAHLLQRLPRFDPKKGTVRQFAAAVIHRFGKNLLRDQRAAKRGPAAIASLDLPVPGKAGGQVTLGETVSADQSVARRGTPPRDPEESVDLRLDVEESLNRLPPDLRKLVELLKQKSTTEVSQALGIPRTSVYTQITQLRRCFEDAGLQEYLQP